LSIINDVLDMSAIDSDKLKIAHAPFDLKSLLSGISTMYYTQCKQKEITFNLILSDLIEEFLIGDSLRINQILINLLSNAYKFTPKGGTINMIVKQMNRNGNTVFLRFIISDSGCGISEEMQQRIFMPFEQETTQTAQIYGGSGLGLSIVKNLVDMMQGAIKLESKKNFGTTFTVDLPFGVDTKLEGSNNINFKDIRALIVDDDNQTIKYTSIVLERMGVRFDVANGGEQAVKIIANEYNKGIGYDVCFIDWKMPGISGVELTKKIREFFDKDTIIIIVSAYDLSEIEDEAKLAGADMFISKPLFQSTVCNLLMTLSGGQYTKFTCDKEHYDFTGKRVLLAEDNALNREIAIELLKIVNLDVEYAENGQTALEMFTNSSNGYYDVILMDIQMPIMDGHEAAKAIRKSKHIQALNIPIYAMTANAFTEDVSAALSSGMNGHIAKPIDTQVLYSTLKQCFQEKKDEY
ncbi:MAG: response regulator, partial [Oscillospiraceae bacterium]